MSEKSVLYAQIIGCFGHILYMLKVFVFLGMEDKTILNFLNSENGTYLIGLPIFIGFIGVIGFLICFFRKTNAPRILGFNALMFLFQFFGFAIIGGSGAV